MLCYCDCKRSLVLSAYFSKLAGSCSSCTGTEYVLVGRKIFLLVLKPYQYELTRTLLVAGQFLSLTSFRVHLNSQRFVK